ncbi:MAG: type III secretion system protein [Chlamydiae bacterium SM23_39]|nr:MAG: type III secretion system protein [Chlamydiae bacterium SM23_39]
MAEKTEKATPKKLRDARKKGQVAKSQDFPSAFTFVVSIIGTLFASSYLYKNLGGYIVKCFKDVSSDIDMSTKAGGYLMEAIKIIAISSFPIVIIVALVGVLVSFLVVGPVFSFKAMKFDFKRLNPVEGIKQKFKLRTIVELLKSIFKITGAAIIIYFAIWNAIAEVVQTSSIPVIGSAFLLQDFLKKISIRVGIFFLLVAIFDLAFQRRTFAKQMMMEKFEVKQEYRDTEGDPLIKSKRRERFREIAYQEGPIAASRAKMIVTNPTSIAVAIGYEKEKDPVPTILVMGTNKIADSIIKVAIEYNIPIMRNVALARELFNTGKIGDYIPRNTYKAVAEVLKWIAYLEEKEKVEFVEFLR